MKKILLSLLAFISLNIQAQYVTTFAKNADIGQSDGVLYYLSQNVIRVDFIIEQTQYFKGPYCDYAAELLGVTDFIKENSTSYSIKDMIVSIDSEPDPNAVYYVTTDEKSKDSNGLNFCLSDDGVIIAFGYQKNDFAINNTSKTEKIIINTTQEVSYQYVTLKNQRNSDTIVKTISEDSIVKFENVIPDSEEKLSPLEKAQVIVEELVKTRQAYHDLISGFQEVNYGSTLTLMTQELKNLENEYISMFLGKSVRKITEKTVYFIPEHGQEKSNITIAKFSENEGLMPSNAKGGEAVKIQFSSNGNFSNVNVMNKDALETTKYNNKLFYRIPGVTSMKITVGEELFFEQRLKISQFGTIMLAPMNKMKLIFDPMTGQITSITKE